MAPLTIHLVDIDKAKRLLFAETIKAFCKVGKTHLRNLGYNASLRQAARKIYKHGEYQFECKEDILKVIVLVWALGLRFGDGHGRFMHDNKPIKLKIHDHAFWELLNNVKTIRNLLIDWFQLGHIPKSKEAVEEEGYAPYYIKEMVDKLETAKTDVSVQVDFPYVAGSAESVKVVEAEVMYVTQEILDPEPSTSNYLDDLDNDATSDAEDLLVGETEKTDQDLAANAETVVEINATAKETEGMNLDNEDLVEDNTEMSTNEINDAQLPEARSVAEENDAIEVDEANNNNEIIDSHPADTESVVEELANCDTRFRRRHQCQRHHDIGHKKKFFCPARHEKEDNAENLVNVKKTKTKRPTKVVVKNPIENIVDYPRDPKPLRSLELLEPVGNLVTLAARKRPANGPTELVDGNPEVKKKKVRIIKIVPIDETVPPPPKVTPELPIGNEPINTQEMAVKDAVGPELENRVKCIVCDKFFKDNYSLTRHEKRSITHGRLKKKMKSGVACNT